MASERERFERQLKTVCKGKGQCTHVQCCHLWAVAAITIIRLPWLGSLQPIAGHFEGVLNPQFISAAIALGTGSLRPLRQLKRLFWMQFLYFFTSYVYYWWNQINASMLKIRNFCNVLHVFNKLYKILK